MPSGPAPGRDDKIVAAWNGLAVAALAETGAYFDRPDLVEAAIGAADLLVRLHMDDRARLARTSKDGQVGANAGVLEDYADVAEGFLALASVTGEGVWLEFAGFLLDHVLVQFTDAESGALYDTAADAEQLIRRPQDPTDNATPSGWSAAAGALLSYAAQTGAEPHRTAAERALGVVKALGPRAPALHRLGAGRGRGAARRAARDRRRRSGRTIRRPGNCTARRSWAPRRAPSSPSALRTVTNFRCSPTVRWCSGEPAAYVCRNFTCDAPTSDVRAAARGRGQAETPSDMGLQRP